MDFIDIINISSKSQKSWYYYYKSYTQLCYTQLNLLYRMYSKVGEQDPQRADK